MIVSAPTTKAALQILNEIWPGGLEFESLFHSEKSRVNAAFHKKANQQQAADQTRLAEDLMTLYTRSLLNATVESPAFVVEPGHRPATTPLARLQSLAGNCVTSRRHTMVRLNDLNRKILSHLTAEHDRSVLCDIIEQSVSNGEFQIQIDGQRVGHIDRANIDYLVEDALHFLARNALLIQ